MMRQKWAGRDLAVITKLMGRVNPSFVGFEAYIVSEKELSSEKEYGQRILVGKLN